MARSHENNQHYSEQGGHKQRGFINRSLLLAQQVFGRPVSRGEIEGAHSDRIHMGKRKMLRPEKPPGKRS